MSESTKNKKDFPHLYDKENDVIHTLSGRIITIGSAKECSIRFEGRNYPAIIAHCIYTKGRYQIQVLTKDIPVYINGKEISEPHLFNHGDIIKIGKKELSYRDKEDAAGKEDSPADPATTAFVHFEELVATVVNLLRQKSDNVFVDLVASVSRLLKCDAARLVGEDPEEGSRNTIARFPEGIALDRFSNRAIEWANEASKTILMHRTDWTDQEEVVVSLEQNAIASLLCAPLRHGSKTLGYLYLDRLSMDNPFTEKDRAFCDKLIPLFTEILINAEEHTRQRETIERLQKAREQSKEAGIIYESTIMADVVTLSKKYALTNSPVLITGETGTGKELIAKLIHRNSSRINKPFRAINCGAIPENLMESELFGCEKGAFTGASQRKLGLFEYANGGTVFLDEIGELPLSLQVKLLRVLQESELIRIGSNETVHIDVRIVAASNRNLDTEVAEKRFRQDLFYRLNVLTLVLPPLKDRGKDIMLLSEYFITKYCEQFGLPQKRISIGARDKLLKYNWPGNIRELENIIQKASLISSEKRIEEQDIALPGTIADSASINEQPDIVTLKDARNKAEKDIIIKTLIKASGNISQSAKLLDIDRKWLMKKMDDLTISADEYRR